MVIFLSKNEFIHKLRRYTIITSPLLKPYFSQLSLKYSSVALNLQSFTVSHLTNSCGFSPELALSVSKNVGFKTPEKPDSVLAFFRSHGFSNSQITYIVRRYPTLLLSNPKKTLLPKLLFFQSKGASSMDIRKIVSKDPKILKRSVEEHIIPAFNFLKSFLHSDERTITSVKRFPGIIAGNLQKKVLLSFKLFHEVGVPESKVVYFLYYQPRMFTMDSNRFKEILGEVMNFGFNPSKSNFVQAVHAIRSMSKSTWERKIKIYKRWGWSDEDVLAAFRCHPWCMTLSEDKIMGFMNFFVNELGWDSLLISKNPILISLSLKKRIIPRASVMQLLFQKGLVKKLTSSQPYMCTEILFLDKFVHLYPDEAPHLLKIYTEKLNFETQQL